MEKFGINAYLDEVITHHEPPLIKTWETIGTPKLLVVGDYQTGIEITPQDAHWGNYSAGFTQNGVFSRYLKAYMIILSKTAII